MRLSFSESIACFLLLSQFGGISANEGDIGFVEQDNNSKRDNEKNLRQQSPYSDDVSEWEYGEKIHEATEYNVHKDCSSFTLTFNTGKDTHFHMPTECPYHMVSEEEQAVCDPPDKFPMKCTFHLIDHSNEFEENYGQRRMVADMDGFNHTSLEKVVSNERDLVSRSIKKSSSVSKRGDQFMWAAESYNKFFFAQSITKCTPKDRGRKVRSIDCDLCGIFPCNCNCRGWKQFGLVCLEPCGGEFTQDIKPWCFKSCSDTVKLHTGCGFIPGERTCVKNDHQCISKYVNHAINIMDVVLFFCSAGTVSTLKKAVAVAMKIVKASTRKAALKIALKDIASEMTRKLVNNPQIKKELKQYSYDVGQRILEQGAVLLIASNLNEITKASEDIKNVVLEVAKAVDPSGMVSLVSGFVPPDDCDEVSFTKIPEENNYLPDTEVLEAIDAIDDIVAELNIPHGKIYKDRCVQGNDDIQGNDKIEIPQGMSRYQCYKVCSWNDYCNSADYRDGECFLSRAGYKKSRYYKNCEMYAKDDNYYFSVGNSDDNDSNADKPKDDNGKCKYAGKEYTTYIGGYINPGKKPMRQRYGDLHQPRVGSKEECYHQCKNMRECKGVQYARGYCKMSRSESTRYSADEMWVKDENGSCT